MLSNQKVARCLQLLSVTVTLAASVGAATVTAATQHGWAKHRETPPSMRLKDHKLIFRFVSRHPNAIHEAIRQISDPGSDRFRQYLDDSEISKLVSTSPASRLVFNQWLHKSMPRNASYAVDLSPHEDYVFVTAKVWHWERIFGSFALFRNGNSDILRLAQGVRCAGQHVPDHARELAGHVIAIFGLSDFYPKSNKEQPSIMAHSADPNQCAGSQFKGKAIDPTVLGSLYHATPVPSGGARRPGFGKHSQGVAAFEDAQFIPADVAEFQANFSLSDVKVQVLGPNKGGYYGEASLDTQYIFSTGSGVDTWFLAQEDFNMLEWAFLVMNMTAPPMVLSVSWGGGESTYDIQHQLAANVEFAKMGLKGHTILAASGDDGTGKQGTLFKPCERFDPNWPASAQYVTAVGGTYLDTAEIGWGQSGGGFSAVFPRPLYQDEKVKQYTATASLPDASLFNISGRATPDVSAVATNFRLLTRGAWGCLSGTSAATPVFAGLISLINDHLVATGKPTVGFINPVLYKSRASIGFDVVEGNNKAQFCSAGFDAVKGWDAVTGLGTPLMAQLQQLLWPDDTGRPSSTDST
eukprot:m.8749 g.8749  ORF g.8749 m.8749 type:complete len:580 (+) comp6714_c0_seq1:18-1757(+)